MLDAADDVGHELEHAASVAHRSRDALGHLDRVWALAEIGGPDFEQIFLVSAHSEYLLCEIALLAGGIGLHGVDRAHPSVLLQSDPTRTEEVLP